jgi:hypothetical protein
MPQSSFEKCAICNGWVAVKITPHVVATTLDNLKIVLHTNPCFRHSEAEYRDVQEVRPQQKQKLVWR